MWFHVSPFEGTVKSVNDKFHVFFLILSEKLAVCVISREIAKITGIGPELDLTI